MNELRVHDLVLLREGIWAVVRRARSGDGVPVGVRGRLRSERFARVVDPAEIVRVVTPEEAAVYPPPREHAVFDALERARDAAAALQLTIGACGACGYELATREPVLHAQSDLDVLVRTAFDDPRLAEFALALRDIEVRLDIEVVLDDGCGATLIELLRGGSVLVKTPDGPVLW